MKLNPHVVIANSHSSHVKLFHSFLRVSLERTYHFDLPFREKQSNRRVKEKHASNIPALVDTHS